MAAAVFERTRVQEVGGLGRNLALSRLLGRKLVPQSLIESLPFLEIPPPKLLKNGFTINVEVIDSDIGE